ncbi:uncharacterized protein SCHCODRAFT_0248956 [Schizophyllum commune H4-8]|uniref:C2H2-type domain-containing protein n=1 Tax=Schizophyllum commune (strain H4-8 / FGSC 9210) TaxID=578458 RepID=D8Q8U3_SCHCM|nr:uncharacterized protein SCHCODRAFT_0248956 [Schizophyllum commune H4-8]KAI5890670.1 hypothetical protein SCHCODRAFT_0248956 [Schizophyllum commune H4-8]
MQPSHYDASTWAVYRAAASDESMSQSSIREGRRSRRQYSAVPKAEYTEHAMPVGGICYDRSRMYEQELTSTRVAHSNPDVCYSPWARDDEKRQTERPCRHLCSPLAQVLTALPDHGYYDTPEAVYWESSEPIAGGNSNSPEMRAAQSRYAQPAMYDYSIVPSQRQGLYGPYGSANSVGHDGRGQGGGNPGPLSRNQLLAQYSTIADALTPVVNHHLPCHSPEAQITGLPYSDDREPCVPNDTTDTCSAGETTSRKAASKRHMCTICQKCFPPGGLQTHMNAHNNVKFECGHDDCSMCFSVQSNARRHRRNAHGIGFAERYEDAQRRVSAPPPDITFNEPVVNEQADYLAVPQRLMWMPPNDSLDGSPRRQ